MGKVVVQREKQKKQETDAKQTWFCHFLIPSRSYLGVMIQAIVFPGTLVVLPTARAVQEVGALRAIREGGNYANLIACWQSARSDRTSLIDRLNGLWCK